MKWHIASVSWGKDSLAMLLTLIAKGYPLNEVVFYDTGMEFEAIYHTRDQMLPRLEQLGIKYTRLEPENPFLFDMLERPERELHGGGAGKGHGETTAYLPGIQKAGFSRHEQARLS